MGFRNDAYAKIWKKEDKGNYSLVALSISHKNKEGNYVTDFSDNFVRFYKNAHEALKAVQVGARIQLKSVDVTTYFDQAKNKQYTNFSVYAFDMPGEYKPKQSKSMNAAPQQGPETVLSIESEDDLPF